MERTCRHCNESFDMPGKVFSNHVKWCKKNPSSPKKASCKHCGKEVNELLLQKHINSCPLNPTNIQRCPACNKVITNADNKYCDSSCFATHHNAKNTKNIRQQGYKFSNQKRKCSDCGELFDTAVNSSKDTCDGCMLPRQMRDRNCAFCGKLFTLPYWHEADTCSKDCCRKLLSKLSRENPNVGGETNFYKYSYKGITMDSSWEVRLAQYLDEKNVKWIRSRSICFKWIDLQGDERRYYPDFYLPEHKFYLDPKYQKKLEDDRDKLNRVVTRNQINLVCGDIDKLLDYLNRVFAKEVFPEGLVLLEKPRGTV